ncbi:MAG: phytoene/squalene synthase family protein [Acidimicrobiaceae bacterium]|nr:phytoene/squalene synthase family protein [Acidimicrobiaceae bacterium]
MAPLDASYERCRQLARAHGTSYYWSAWLLPPERRRHAHALYAFCRLADDIVDDLGPAGTAERSAALDILGARLFADLDAGVSQHPVLSAVVDTVHTLDIDPDCFRRFLRSMRMDLAVERYPTFDDLLIYMDGSAAVIGEMMLPVLNCDHSNALDPARDLGIAFQLTNFCRDVAEDLGRHRVYLPLEDIDRFGAGTALAGRRVTGGWIACMRFQIERARRYYDSAEAGIDLLPPRSARCVRVASRLYGGILERIERRGYDVFSSRVSLPTWQKVAVAARAHLPAPRFGLAPGTTGASMP